ncbi:hypothetical protein NQ314_007697 [Rhamnusium bicolor]|uniref:Uncharacterized protein n=1 Tax=Rhamnusium bicolor TaxID=1586634 RepID=A0AAV8YIU2_9CUCU|nr:hypothetical protein NQ314_007697 [Rhamnusium bicolor]
MITVTHYNELPLRIEHCVSVKINGSDSLPKTVCTECIQRINDWFDFKEMCIKSNEKLNLQIENEKVLNVKEEIEGINNVKFNNWTYSDSEDIEESECEGEEFISEECYNNQVKIECLQNIYKCEFCSKEFDEFLEYLEHQDEHNGQSVFSCDKCEKLNMKKKHKCPCPKCGKMILKASLHAHLIQHTDRHVCTHCSHRFGSKATLQQHIITVHTDIKDHICEACGKRFSSKTSMNVHLKTHKEKREYTCKLCNYAGRTSSALYIHMATHAKEMHCCEMCPKVFKSSRNLSDHLRRAHSKEKKHQCSYCDKKFVDRYMMMVHVRTHTGVRPYKCKLCDKAFIRSDSLKEHMVTHGSRTFYDCSQCMKKFTSKRGYARHNCTISAV